MIRIAKAEIQSFKDPFRPPAIHLQTAVQETQCFQGLLGKLLDVLTASQCKKHPTPENTPNQSIFGASLILVGLQLAHSPRTTRNRILTSDYQTMNGCKHGGSDPQVKAQWLGERFAALPSIAKGIAKGPGFLEYLCQRRCRNQGTSSISCSLKEGLLVRRKTIQSLYHTRTSRTPSNWEECTTPIRRWIYQNWRMSWNPTGTTLWRSPFYVFPIKSFFRCPCCFFWASETFTKLDPQDTCLFYVVWVQWALPPNATRFELSLVKKDQIALKNLRLTSHLSMGMFWDTSIAGQILTCLTSSQF